MKKLGLTILSAAMALCSVQAAAVPVSVSKIETYLINEQLVRVIQHNMEVNSVLEIEILSRPIEKVLQHRAITEVTVGEETLRFADSAGTFVEAFGATDDSVTFTLDYFYRRGGNYLIDCVVSVDSAALNPPVCQFRD
uniref:hypothetical protein n=1 Tax=Thaumasiovibrio occultus TaxID=1891184 RepID=UPI000B351BBB|nr:hypothetical protein [Thaumasiovibrio occultus]